jgi:hypothetical protein
MDIHNEGSAPNHTYRHYTNTEAEMQRRIQMEMLLNTVNPFSGMSEEEFMREYQVEFFPNAYPNNENQDDNGQSENKNIQEEEIKEEKKNDKPDDIGTIFGKIDID